MPRCVQTTGRTKAAAQRPRSPAQRNVAREMRNAGPGSIRGAPVPGRNTPPPATSESWGEDCYAIGPIGRQVLLRTSKIITSPLTPHATRAQLRRVHARLYPQCYKQSPFKDCAMGRIFETRHTRAGQQQAI